MAWATLGIAVFAAATATVSVGWQIYVHFAASKAERRERAGRVLGAVMTFLWTTDPETGYVGGIPEHRINEAVHDRMSAWEDHRRELEALRVADPRSAVNDTAVATIEAVTESFGDSTWALRQQRPLSKEEWANVLAKFAAAQNAAEALRRAVLG
jgi:hypothetical protein